MNEPVCTDDHSSAVPGRGHCPLHGYDDSVPAPAGFTYQRVLRADGQIYSALVMLPVPA